MSVTNETTRANTRVVESLAQDAVPIDVSQLFAYNAIKRCLNVGAIMGEKTRRLILRNAGDAATRHRKQYPRSATRPEVVVPVDNVKLTPVQRAKGLLTDPEYRSLNAPTTLRTGEQMEEEKEKEKEGGEAAGTPLGKRTPPAPAEQRQKRMASSAPASTTPTPPNPLDEDNSEEEDEEEPQETQEREAREDASGSGGASGDSLEHRAELKVFMQQFKTFPDPDALRTLAQGCRELTLLYLQEQSYVLSNVPSENYPNADQRAPSGKAVSQLCAEVQRATDSLYQAFVHNVSVFAGEVASVKKTLRLFDHIREGRILRVEWSSERLFHPRESSKGTDVHCRLSKCNKGLRVVRVTWRDAVPTATTPPISDPDAPIDILGTTEGDADAAEQSLSQRQENYILATHFSDLLYAFLVATNPLAFYRHFAHARALLQGVDNARKVWELQGCGRTEKEFIGRRERTMDVMDVLIRHGEFPGVEEEEEENQTSHNAKDANNVDDDDDDDDTTVGPEEEEDPIVSVSEDDANNNNNNNTVDVDEDELTETSERPTRVVDSTLLNPMKPFHRPVRNIAPRPLVWTPTIVLYLDEPTDVHWARFSAECPAAPLIAALPDRIITTVDSDAIAQYVVQAQRRAWVCMSDHIKGLVSRKYPPAKTSVLVQ